MNLSHPGGITITNNGQLPLAINGVSMSYGNTATIYNWAIGNGAPDCLASYGEFVTVNPGTLCIDGAYWSGTPIQAGEVTVTWDTSIGNVSWTFEYSAT